MASFISARDATPERLLALWNKWLPRIVRHTADVGERRRLVRAMFGDGPYKFLEGSRVRVPAWYGGTGSHVGVESAESAALHIGPGYYTLRPDLVEPDGEREGGHIEFQRTVPDEDPAARRILDSAAVREAVQRWGTGEAHVLYTRVVRENRRVARSEGRTAHTVVRRPSPGDVLTAIDRDGVSHALHVLLEHMKPQRYLVVAFL